MIWQCAVQRLLPDLVGGTDEKVIAAATPKIELVLQEIERIKGGSKFLAGDQVSLADLYVAPVLAYLVLTPEARLLGARKSLSAWWESMGQRSSFKETAPKLG